MKDEKEEHEGEFGMEPARFHNFRVLEDEGCAEQDGGYGGGAQDEVFQFGFHQREGGGGLGVLDMVHEQAGHIKKPCEPGGEGNNVEGFEG